MAGLRVSCVSVGTFSKLKLHIRINSTIGGGGKKSFYKPTWAEISKPYDQRWRRCHWTLWLTPHAWVFSMKNAMYVYMYILQPRCITATIKSKCCYKAEQRWPYISICTFAKYICTLQLQTSNTRIRKLWVRTCLWWMKILGYGNAGKSSSSWIRAGTFKCTI